MRELNETIASIENNADECTGHCWEGRFKLADYCEQVNTKRRRSLIASRRPLS